MTRVLRKRVTVPVAVLVLLGGAGAYLYSTRVNAVAQYRTAVASMGSVTQTLPMSGNLAALNQTYVDFPAAGKVSAVKVTVGQTVKAGDTLASLDPTSLQGALTQAQATLAAAQARLALDQAGATAQSLVQAQASVAMATVNLSNAKSSLSDTTAVGAQAIAQAQAAITSAQALVAADQGLVDADTQSLVAAQQTASNDGCSGSSPSQNCPQDEKNVQTDQHRLSADQQTLGRDQTAAAAAQSGLEGARVRAQQTDDQAQAQVGAAQVQLQNAQAALAALLQGATSQQIQIDQSQVAVAQVNVDAALQGVDQATLPAPIDGAVNAVTVSAGQTVAAGATSSPNAPAAAASSVTHAFTIISPGTYSVTGSVSDAQISQIAVGQPARVTPAGSGQSLTGKVSAIATVATVSSGVATFPVTVTIDGTHPELHAGVSASVDIIVNQVSQVLTVPTSALHVNGTNITVQMMVAGQPQSRAVQVGASDSLRTQVISGLEEGDLVEVARVTSTVPTNTNTGGGRGFGGGGVRVRSFGGG